MSDKIWLAGRVIGTDLSHLARTDLYKRIDAELVNYPTLQAFDVQINGEFFSWLDGPEVSNDELIERTKKIIIAANGGKDPF